MGVVEVLVSQKAELDGEVQSVDCRVSKLELAVKADLVWWCIPIWICSVVGS